MTYCPLITQTLGIISVRCIPLSFRSKTQRRATLLFPTWIYTCQSVGTVNFALLFTTSVTISISILQTFHSWVATSHPRRLRCFISQLIQYARACSSYECFILRAMRLSNKLLGQGYVKERLKSSLRKFYGRYCFASHSTLFGQLSLMEFRNVYCLYCNFTRFYMVYQRLTMLTPIDTWSCPIWDFRNNSLFLCENQYIQNFSCFRFWIWNISRYFYFTLYKSFFIYWYLFVLSLVLFFKSHKIHKTHLRHFITSVFLYDYSIRSLYSQFSLYQTPWI